MAQVPIPWFRGGPMMAGKAERKRRQLQALATTFGGIGSLWRQERQSGLPKGMTDQDLIDEEHNLEGQLNEQQTKAQADATHGVEQATSEGDPATADAIKNDPAGHAMGRHEAAQTSMLGQLGGFMESGVKRLLWGDPQRAERLAHVRRMQGELDFQKRRLEYLKTVGPIAMKSEDPDAVLQATGGGRFGITHLPKQRATAKGAGTSAAADDPFAPEKVGGSGAFRSFYTEAKNNVLRRHNFVVPEDAPARQAMQDEIFQEARRLEDAHTTGVQQKRHQEAKELFEQKQKLLEKNRRAREAHKEGLTGGGSETRTRNAYFDEHGNEISSDEAMRRASKHLPFSQGRVVEHTTVPAVPRDPGKEAGMPPMYTQ